MTHSDELTGRRAACAREQAVWTRRPVSAAFGGGSRLGGDGEQGPRQGRSCCPGRASGASPGSLVPFPGAVPPQQRGCWKAGASDRPPGAVQGLLRHRSEWGGALRTPLRPHGEGTCPPSGRGGTSGGVAPDQSPGAPPHPPILKQGLSTLPRAPQPARSWPTRLHCPFSQEKRFTPWFCLRARVTECSVEAWRDFKCNLPDKRLRK